MIANSAICVEARDRVLSRLRAITWQKTRNAFINRNGRVAPRPTGSATVVMQDPSFLPAALIQLERKAASDGAPATDLAPTR